MKHADLSEEELEIALALQAVRNRYILTERRLTEALGRPPTAEEMMEVAPHLIEMINQLWEAVALLDEQKSVRRIPESLLVQLHMAKILDESS